LAGKGWARSSRTVSTAASSSTECEEDFTMDTSRITPLVHALPQPAQILGVDGLRRFTALAGRGPTGECLSGAGPTAGAVTLRWSGAAQVGSDGDADS